MTATESVRRSQTHLLLTPQGQVSTRVFPKLKEPKVRERGRENAVILPPGSVQPMGDRMDEEKLSVLPF